MDWKVWVSRFGEVEKKFEIGSGEKRKEIAGKVKEERVGETVIGGYPNLYSFSWNIN